MKLPASLLATVALAAGCEKVDFEHRSAAPAAEPTAKVAPVETVRVIEEAQPAAAPIWRAEPTPEPLVIKPTVTPKPKTKPKAKVTAHVCGPCGMG